MSKELVTSLICTAVLVIFLLVLLLHKKKDGALVIDTSDPEKDLYQLKIDVPLESLPKKKSITLTIEVVGESNDISQKIHLL